MGLKLLFVGNFKKLKFTALIIFYVEKLQQPAPYFLHPMMFLDADYHIFTSGQCNYRPISNLGYTAHNSSVTLLLLSSAALLISLFVQWSGQRRAQIMSSNWHFFTSYVNYSVFGLHVRLFLPIWSLCINLKFHLWVLELNVIFLMQYKCR